MHFYDGHADLSSSYCSILPKFLASTWKQMAEPGQGLFKPEEPLVMQKKNALQTVVENCCWKHIAALF